jgi:two-component system nitrogen regulation sensor histidine kinase GlnL
MALHDYGQAILDNLNTAVMLFDEVLCLSYINPAAEMLFNVSARHMLGLPVGQLIAYPESLTQENLQRVMETGRPFTEREMNLPLGEGRQATVDCTATPITANQGNTKGLLIELQPLDRHLRISREAQLRSQHDAVRDLVRGMAHEIKNPLGGLRGAAQLLQMELEDPALHEYTGIIMAEADRLQNLVNRMLGPNRLPAPSLVNIHTLLERVRQLVLAEEDRRLNLVRDYDPSIPDIHVDSDTVVQALLNIVRNAARVVRNQSDGQIILRTRVLRRFTINHICHRLVLKICVEDNGPGIPKEIRKKLFYPMVSTSEEGMGVGLSISQSLINKHGGLVECTSKPGMTQFNVLLPMENPHVEK